ncbi:hypothetical protein BDV26DRAFT_131096 [Aspergillus bertholletiae]|uniref:Uncharacterized protein n=1 Tax=Aspergillus bertholletiae TaxID=1226010 RepID=A0A5N7BFQ2_9EURO|nr:hypothetical protein BDV26DRAFT_131096 [Aspergillus bertholletiae]
MTTMRLRDSIRRPERYESEHFYTSLGQKPLRQHRNITHPPYIDFDPNLPPAAFPTLNFPRPAVPEAEKGGQRKREGDANDGNTPQHSHGQPGHHVETKNSKETGVDLEDIPIDQVKNYIASNGDLNLVYVKNMATITDADPSSASNYLHRETDGIKIHNEDASMIPSPKWSDLCPGMKVEIFDNLLQRHSWIIACHKLGLSREEQEEVEEDIAARDKQMEREELQMKNMRRRQLKALLKIDNSARYLQDSHQFVFRKISREATGHLQKRTRPDYLMCHSKEVMNARRYLYQHGLDPRYAGDWDNSISPAHPSGTGQGQDMSDIGKQVDCAQYVELATDATDDDRMDFAFDPPLIPDKQSFINTIGTAALASPEDMTLCRGNLNTAPRWLNLLYRHSICNYQPAFRENKLVCLKIGRERAAQIHDTQPIACIQPAKLVKRFPPIDAIYYDTPSWTLEITQTNGAGTSSARPPRAQPTVSSKTQPLQRIMGGNWSYSSFKPPATTSSMRFQQNLEEARLETQGPRSPGTQHLTSGRSHEFHLTSRQSTTTAAQRFMSPSSSGEIHSASLTCQGKDPRRTIASTETSLQNSLEWRPVPGTIDSPTMVADSYQSGNLGTPPSVAHAMQVDEEQERMRYEDEHCATDDEVVLLPAGNPH